MTPKLSAPENFAGPQNESALRPHNFKKALGRVGVASLAVIGLPVATVGLETAAAPPAAAALNSYTDGDAYDCSASFGIYAWCKGGSWLSPRGFAYRNCTDYAAQRINLLTGATVPADLGNATNWDDAAIGRFGVDNSPEPGDAAVWDGDAYNPYGHVAVVESVNPDGTVNVSEYNQTGQGIYSERAYVNANHYVDFNGPNTPAPQTVQPVPASNYLQTLLDELKQLQNLLV